jgi:hypothetical protein
LSPLTIRDLLEGVPDQAGHVPLPGVEFAAPTLNGGEQAVAGYLGGVAG